jgi:oxalate---CoA ligase
MPGGSSSTTAETRAPEQGQNATVAAAARTIAEAISLHAEQQPDRPAIICTGFPALSFRELNRKIEQIGTDLREAGIGASSRVGVALPNGPEAAIVAVAVSAHAVGFPLNPALTASEFEFELTRADLDAVVLSGWTASPATAPAAARSIGVFHAAKANSSLDEIGLERVVEVRPERRRSGAPSPRSVSVIQMSSGSTGIPKLILVTHANLFDIADKMRTWFGLSGSDRCACILPISSGFGFKIALVAPLLIGGSVAFAMTQRPDDIATWGCDLDPTWFVATPTVLHAALDKLRAAADGNLEHSLRFFASTSAYLPQTVRTGLEAILGIPALEFYGLREAGIVAANPAPPATRHADSVGLVSADVAILDDDGAMLPRGSAGAIAVRGMGISPGYIEALPLGCDVVAGSDTATNKWSLTGDLGIIDADGFLSIIGRIKEIINRGGEKISPYEVEKALLQHPQVSEAGVFAVPHPRLGENVAAAVVLVSGAATTPSELRDFVRGHLTGFKIPQRIDLVTALPKGPSGKISRAELTAASTKKCRLIDPPEQPLEFQIVEIWQRLLHRVDIGIHDDFFEAGGDSLLAAEMLLEVEAAIAHAIPQSALAQASTIRQIAKIAAQDNRSCEELVTKAKDGTGRPFFFCHGDYSTRGFYAIRLASLLDTDRPVYLIHPLRDVNENSDIYFEQLANRYLPHLLTMQPAGKFQIGGFCNGGLLAWEIARQLIRAGREVESVFLVETISLNCRPSFRAIRQVLHAVTIGPLAATTFRRIRRDSMRKIWNVARKTDNIKSRLEAAGETSLPFDDRDLPYFRAMSNYIPKKLDVEVTAIVCEQNAKASYFSPIAWKRVSRGLNYQTVPGQHLTCITTYVAALAEVLNQYLTGLEPRPPLGKAPPPC